MSNVLSAIYVAKTKVLISCTASLFSHVQKEGFLMTRLISQLSSEYSLSDENKTRRDIYLINLDSFVQFYQLAYVIEKRVLFR